MTITLNRACDAVRFRDTAKGQQQRDVLRQLERDSGRKRSAIVADLDAELNVGHDQYRRYLRGDTPLRWDQIDAFARACRTTKADLVRALGLMDDEPDPEILRRTNAALGQVATSLPPAQVRETARRLGEHPERVQEDLLRRLAVWADEMAKPLAP